MWSAVNMENVELDFVYEDADTHANEMAELYCYTEEQEILNNQTSFQDFLNTMFMPRRWCELREQQRTLVWQKIADGLELVDEGLRWRSLQSLHYLIQGTFGECETIDQSFQIARRHVMTAYANGIFPGLLHVLVWETERSCHAYAASVSLMAISPLLQVTPVN